MEKNTKVNIDEWNVTAMRYVTFIDIMGFKDFVARNTHDYVYEKMKSIDDKKKFSENIKWAKIESKLVKTTTYSDSIMIYSKDDSNNSFNALINTTASLVYDLFIEGIPHKGAMAFGTMTLDTVNSIFFGQPLIDAYLLQEELAFYGIVIHASAEKEIHKNEYSTGFIRPYLCPFKNGKANHLTIRPMFSIPLVKETEDRKNILIEAIKNLRHETSGHLRKYIDFTEEYMKSLLDNSK